MVAMVRYLFGSTPHLHGNVSWANLAVKNIFCASALDVFGLFYVIMTIQGL